jgi:uncharacterized membrane protein YdbT with pleckstrin-like domain
MEEQKNEQGYYSYLIRQSVVFLVFRILTVEVLILISHFLIRYILQQLFTLINAPFSVELLFIEAVFVQFINLYFLVVVVLSWINEYYVLNPKEVVIKKGILSSRSTTYEFANLQSMTIRQSFWGRIFNYGTIKLYNPVLRTDVYLTNIPNPQKSGAIIQQHQPDITPIIRKPNT